MKIIRRAMLCSCVAAALVTIGFSAQVAHAQNGQKIAVVDVARIFKAHGKFNQGLESMKIEAQNFQNMMEVERQKLTSQAEGLRDLDKSDPQFRALETSISKSMAELQVSQNQKAREITDKEAALYYDTYVEVSGVIANFADENGISLVLRYNSAPIDQSNRSSVIEGVNRDVVFQMKRDITDQIIAIINGPGAGAASRTRPGVNR